jgi:hypothetical protein
MAFYKSYKPRTFDPGSAEPFKVSRSKIDFFGECPRCFYMEARFGLKRPSMPSFTLNIAVDALLKKEFDTHRASGTKHPIMDQYGVDAVPFRHTQMDTWRENFVGVQALHRPTNLLVFGAVDDIWVGPTGELFVVDYKATSKDGVVDKLDDTRWHNQYRRQMEVYQWLLRQNGFQVSDTGYFVYVNGKKDRKAFDGKLEFDVALIPYTGSDTWVESALQNIKNCLLGSLPASGENCEFCPYRSFAASLESGALKPGPVPKKEQNVPKKQKKIAPASNDVLF